MPAMSGDAVQAFGPDPVLPPVTRLVVAVPFRPCTLEAALQLNAEEEVMAKKNDKQWCFAWYQAPVATTGETRAALVKDHKWKKGDTITISFVDGTEAQKALVRRFAEGWIKGLANLTFSWGPPPHTNIWISFAYRGWWSVVGTTCKSVPKSQPTMNLGWLDPGVTD